MPRIDIKLLLSKQFLLFFAVLWLGSEGIVAWLPIGFCYKSLLAVIALGYFIWILYQQKQWVSVRHDQAGWHVQYANKTWDATLCADSTVTNWVSVLRFVPVEGGKKRSCVIFNDMTDSNQYQQLLVRTRFFK